MTDIAGDAGLSRRTVRGIRDVLAGRRRGLGTAALFAGPAVTVSIAYVDPGNFATNIAAGAGFGYRLLGVVALAGLVAMLFQALSAKLGIATGRNLAELCRERFPPPAVYAMWAVSEVAAMATDLAEFLGGAIGFSLLFRMPLLAGMLVTAALTWAILMCERRGFRPLELVIGGLVAVIGVCCAAELAIAPVAWGEAARHTVMPELPGLGAIAVAVGIVGATVMPHALYLHSGLTQARAPARNDRERRFLARCSNREVVVALSLAGVANMAMVALAAAVFHAGHPEVAEIGTAYRLLTPLLGAGAAGVFLVSLIASGVASSVVGTMAGQMIMQGFVGFAIPLWMRRLITMLPSFAVVTLGVNATTALVMSQIVLSLALPVPMIALILFTRRRGVMRDLANHRLTDLAAIAATGAILALNLLLVAETIAGMP
ncbi:MAG TPA: Nramp family divalent metal transporter [Stellaceae bacterium]|jgi:manganese transport protein|nr:Nramp family divalent metal transporter [Stellaceae bacterium]